MTQLDALINKYNGKPCEVVDSTNKNQCFDLAMAWTDSLGIPRVFPFLNATQIYTDFGSEQAKYFTRIENGLFNAPQAGDIVVFRKNHVVVATGNSNLWSFEAFSQNDPVGSYCAVKWYNYGYLQNTIYGWLHPLCLDKITPEEFRKRINDKIETQITDTAFRNWVREQLKISA